MTAVHEPPNLPESGLRVPPSLTPLGLATQVTKAIQHQDLRMRQGGAPDEVLALRSALDALQDVMARVLMVEEAMLRRPDYERLAGEVRGMVLATMNDGLEPAELRELRSWVATATIKLAIIVALTA